LSAPAEIVHQPFNGSTERNLSWRESVTPAGVRFWECSSHLRKFAIHRAAPFFSFQHYYPNPSLVLLVDNFDSFTYNLADYVRQCGTEVMVVRNNTPLSRLNQYNFDSVILSPGPQTPRQSGNLMAILDLYAPKLPVLGICLGHQAIGEYFGATLKRAAWPMHGKISTLHREDDPIFSGTPACFGVVRYHSLILEELPPALEAIAWTSGGEIMALRHRHLPLRGIQFHPEAALTEYGLQMIRNWLNFARVPS
jgi:anthranilate synthase component 2